MECDAGDGRAVRLEGMPCWSARKPAGWVLVPAEEGCGRGGVEFAL